MPQIRAVFLDFYNTVARFDPPREQVQTRAASDHGVTVDPAAVRRSYRDADEYLARENSVQALSQRSPQEAGEFWARYEQRLLSGAGVSVDLETAGLIFAGARNRNEGYALFDDAKPTLARLKADGHTVGLISNMDADLWAIADGLGITPYLQFAVTSGDVGASKPNPPVFLEALRRSGADAGEAVHVGDQYLGDVVGARAVGIQPVLIDRDGTQIQHRDCPVIRSLSEAPDLVRGLGRSSRPG